MIRRLVEFSIRQPYYITGGVLTLAGLGLYAFLTIPFEAFPDLTANSVSVIAEAPGQPQVMTAPLKDCQISVFCTVI